MIINSKSIVDQVVTFLEDQIVTGKLRPGEKIREEEIAKLLQVSRPPVREAIKVLEANDLIIRKPRIGAFVTEIKGEDVLEIYTIKASLYQLALDIAMNVIDDSWVSKLEQSVQEMEQHAQVETPNVRKYQTAHEKFHGLIIDLSGNQRLRKIISNLDKQVKRFSYVSLGNREHLTNSCDYHRRIINAIKAKDKSLALQLNHEHIMAALDRLISLFKLYETDKKTNIL
jgi:DNA-binding GntR family transcriptional regulator